ncbi:MAG: 3-deoxy-manno-octulosonate cytidylyltransferase [Robiginitomaculum sp.]|nr:MAG: 3-deoxy-manno-octulosonate cytidylyltransferase [Robiginitomaculum sp.]
MKTRIVIPARMASTRLPGKPLADIGGVPMILRVAEVARQAGFGEPLIAAGDQEIFECARQAGFEAVLTPADLPSGTDRVHAALKIANNAQTHAPCDCVVNLQGDLPLIDPQLIKQVVKVLVQVPSAEIATLVAPIETEVERTNPDIVKAVLTPLYRETSQQEAGQQNGQLFRALYFTRAEAPSGDGPHYQHIGIYAYRGAALDKFTNLPSGTLENRERLEQLRALENGMEIVAALVGQVPQGVDSPDDLARVRAQVGENQ